ncbi:MarR family winged helix-turn-helix transcriptional regulator [Sphingomonas sp. PR090111-T3T-6A]|uniref:MarR family winged helix-turn-helix transcriptional regulator n=1 Tax=Sphingomonas sp. PR090111-T3T-6A TaxID=685778 RepID=UPI0003746EE4|nr:MarR family transcriptional regulator [Sphingomonas sp. PR090111-T3T-6A]
MNQPPDGICLLLRTTFLAMVDRVEHEFDDLGLALSQWLTLKLINIGTISCIGDINRELGLTTGASTRLVDQLENRNLIVRRRGGADRRVVEIMLTDEGQRVIVAIQPRLADLWEEQLSDFEEDERDTLFALLSRLRDGLRRRTDG